MRLKKLSHSILAFVIIICVKAQLKKKSDIFQFPSNGVTQVSLNGHITNISDPMDTSSSNWFHWIGSGSANKDIDIDEIYDSTLIGISPATGPNISRSKRDCKPTISKCGCMNLCSGDLIFEDNFNELNLTNWHREIRISTLTGDGDFVSYQARPENCYVNQQEKQLHIVPTLLAETPGFSPKTFMKSGKLDLLENCTAFNVKLCSHTAGSANILPPIVSARIRTKGSFHFRYGRVEVRAKLPKGDWIFPLIQLEPVYEHYGSHFASGKLIVAFARGNTQLYDSKGYTIDGSVLMGGAVITRKPKLREVRLSKTFKMNHLGDDFHIYTLKWTDKLISMEIDGNEYGTISGEFQKLKKIHNITHAARWEKGTYMAPFDQEFFITLGVSVGGNVYFPDDSKSVINSLKITKPWINWDSKALIKFWMSRNQWRPTWKYNDVDLIVDYRITCYRTALSSWLVSRRTKSHIISVQEPWVWTCGICGLGCLISLGQQKM